MDTETALQFLRDHQPMPPDESLSDELITQYDNVRKYFLAHPNEECIPLFIHSFGKGSGFGVYQLVEDVIRMYPVELVVPPLIDGLRAGHDGIRRWAAEIAELFPDRRLLHPLSENLEGHSDPEVRASAATALQFMPSNNVQNILSRALTKEGDPFARGAIADALARFEGTQRQR